MNPKRLTAPNSSLAPKSYRSKICKTPIVIHSASSRPVIKPKQQFAIIPVDHVVRFQPSPSSVSEHSSSHPSVGIESSTHDSNSCESRSANPPAYSNVHSTHAWTNDSQPSSNYQYISQASQFLNNNRANSLAPPQLPPPPPPPQPPAIYQHHHKLHGQHNQSLLVSTLLANNSSLNMSLNNSVFNNTGPVVVAPNHEDANHNQMIDAQSHRYYQQLLNGSNLYTLFEKKPKPKPPPPYPGHNVTYLVFLLFSHLVSYYIIIF